MQILVSRAKEKGVDIHFPTRVKRPLMKSGCICRVVVELKDEEKVVQSMAIIWVGPQGRDNTIGFLFQ